MILDFEFEVVTMSKFEEICGADVLIREPDPALDKVGSGVFIQECL